MRLIGISVVMLLSSAAPVHAADPNDITAYLTERNGGVRPTDAAIADFLVSPEGVAWRAERGLLPKRDDGAPTFPVTGTATEPTVPTTDESAEGVRGSRNRRRGFIREIVRPPVSDTPSESAVSPTPVEARTEAPAPQPRPGETPAQFQERLRRESGAPAAAVTAARITPEGQVRAQQNVQGMTGLFQSLFKPADPDAASIAPGGAGSASPGSSGSGGSRRGASMGSMPSLGGAEAGSAGGMSLADMEVAQAGGMGQPFRDMGLKVGSDSRGAASVLRADGSPASASEIGELQKRLAREPLAQMQRPDFHQVIARDKFQELRAHYATKPELRGTTFKDVAATPEQRDFLWSRTCSGLDGNCNPNATQGSYSKGRYVAPEDLKNMSLDATKRLAAGSATGTADKKEEKPKAGDAKSFWERLRQEDEEYRRNVAQARGSRAAGVSAPAESRGLGAMLAALSRALGAGSDDGSRWRGGGSAAAAADQEYTDYAEQNAGSGVESRAAPRLGAGPTRAMPEPAHEKPDRRGTRRVVLQVFMAALTLLLAVYVRRRILDRA